MKTNWMTVITLCAAAGTSSIAVAQTQPQEKAADSKNPWEASIEKMADSLTPELIKAFPELESEESAKLRPFLATLKSTGFGAAPEPTESEAEGRRRRRFNSGNTDFVKSFDQDKNGAVTRLELHAAIVAAITESLERRSSIDTDKNGEISKREYATSMPPKFGDVDENGMDGHARGHFNREDTDKDGVLSLKEITGRVEASWKSEITALQLAVRLAAADSNEDKQLTSDEVTALVKNKEAELPESFELKDPIELKGLYQKIRTNSLETLEQLDKTVR